MSINDQCYYQMLGNNNAQRLVLVPLDRARVAVTSRLPVVNSSFILCVKTIPFSQSPHFTSFR